MLPMSDDAATRFDPSSILYEDEAFLFVDKPPGMVVQRGHDLEEPVLVELATSYAAERNESIFLMQRLDRGTSGVMFFSKLAAVNAKLTRQFETKRIRKQYVALCEGELAERQTIDAPLTRVGPISFGVRDEGKRAVTHVEPRSATKQGTLLHIGLETGRTHQIRVHLAAIGHALIGDWLYGARNAPRPMLHARTLTMTHPLTNQPITVSAPIPGDLAAEAASRGITIFE
jgi:23S rRNA pseudouridine1911/1915/1917 synthase